ncbi:MAG: PTS sugar transporter subunit IIC [Longimicrobiales bacterium]|nr:PTS sugar transporter subunit IIC [Longimicrobiales bacterium]
MLEILVLALLGGALTLDQTSFGQFMLARPLVSGALAGWILGAPEAGILAGALLEVLFLPAFPVGGARFPEGGPAGVVGAAASVAAGTGAAGLALGVALGTVWGLLGGASVGALRRINERIAPQTENGEVQPARIVAGHVSGLVLDFCRGSVLTGVGVVVAELVGPEAGAAWPLAETTTVRALAVVATLSLGGLLGGLGGWKRAPGYLAGGLLLGALVGWFL